MACRIVGGVRVGPEQMHQLPIAQMCEHPLWLFGLPLGGEEVGVAGGMVVGDSAHHACDLSLLLLHAVHLFTDTWNWVNSPPGLCG